MKFASSSSRFSIVITFFVLIFSHCLYSQAQDWIDLDTVKARKFDMGKMWTFEYPPINYFEEEYGFTPDESWFKHVQLATLKFADYCSASFVSADGLIMTNHHCARESVTEVSMEGEDLNKDGFIAWDLPDEKPVPNLFVEQCIRIDHPYLRSLIGGEQECDGVPGRGPDWRRELAPIGQCQWQSLPATHRAYQNRRPALDLSIVHDVPAVR